MAGEIYIADKETLDKINVNVGSNSDSTSGTGSVHAKLKDIKLSVGERTDVASSSGSINAKLKDLSSQTTAIQSTLNSVNSNVNSIPKGAVKSVQRGSTAIYVGRLTTSVTISTVNVSKSILIANIASMKYYSNPDVTSNLFMGGVLNSNSIDFSKIMDGCEIKINYQVIEFY